MLHVTTIGTESYDVVARELPPAERDTTYAELAKAAPIFAEYQSKTDRIIPLFELERAQRPQQSFRDRDSRLS